MNEFDKILSEITPEIYANLQNSVAIGKWPNGLRLTAEQREQSLQLIIAYDQLHKNESERVGYVAPKNSHCSHLQTASQEGINDDKEEITPIKIV